MSKIRRRDVLKAALAASACGGADEMAPKSFVIPKSAVPRLPPAYPHNPVYHQVPPASPVHLYGQVLLQPGTSGAVPPTALMNPMGQDMEILEIKFEVSGTSADTGSGAALGGSVRCQLVMGDVKITQGSVPVFCFGRAENLAAEAFTDDTDTLIFNGFSWRLPRPFFVPAGAVLAPTFVHTGIIKDPLTVRISYSARTVFTKPKVINIPYVAKYVTKAFNPCSTGGVDSSTELDLVNANPEPLQLQRIVGRTLFKGFDALQYEGLPHAYPAQYLTARITDSYGRPIVRSYSPLYSIVSAATRSWEMDDGTAMDPNSFYRVDVKVDAQALAGANGDGILQAFLSIVGWREVAV